MSSSKPARWPAIVIVPGLLIVGAAVWYLSSRSGPAPAVRHPDVSVPGVKAPAIPPPPPVVLHESAPELSTLISQANQSPQERLQYIEKVLYLYRQAFGGNPVGHNEQIVSALIGENEKGTALLPKDCPAIKDGFLVDEWGTPYWFHSVSAKDMEIRSAGPDRDLFTADDIVPDVRE